MRMFVPVVGAALALTLTPHSASAAPVVDGGALKAAAAAVGSAENVTYYGYYGRGYGGGYGGYYRNYGYYNYYRPRYYGYYNNYSNYNYYRPYYRSRGYY
jgi:hypothetical protein